VRVCAVVVAAGRGERFGALKQFLPLGDTTVAALSVTAARSVASDVILVVPEEYQGSGEGADRTVIGGATRSASVRNALATLSDVDVVVIHDAARPLATSELFHRVVAALVDDVAGAVPSLEMSDTVKRVDHSTPRRILETLDRTQLVTVQTPQAFRLSALQLAHAGHDDATDDAALLEARGALVVAVTGESTNIKITTPEDFALVSSLVEAAS
jgi:2-C-methyl-D-erythritol 4-phosphate cytidylyltransferase